MSTKSYTIALVNGITRLHVFPKYYDCELEVRDVTFRSGFLLLKKESKLCVVPGIWDSDAIPVEEYNEKHPNRYIEDNKVYWKPHADIHFADGTRRTEYFQTVEELDDFARKIKNLAPHVIL